MPSPFIKEIHPRLYEEVIEQYGGVLVKQGLQKSPLQTMKPHINIFDSFKNAMAESGEETAGGQQETDSVFGGAKPKSANLAVKLGYCRHKVFGRGKIIEEVDSEKVRVNFTGIGLKVIMKAYLTFED